MFAPTPSLCLTFTARHSPEWVETAIDARLPIVITDHFIPGIQAPTVAPDNFAGAYAITRYLIDAGHTRYGRFQPGSSSAIR